MTDDLPEAVVRAVEQAMRRQFAASLPLDDDADGWRQEAEIVARAALEAYEGERGRA